MKFKFSMPEVVLHASDVESALSAVASHITTVCRHVGSGRDIGDCGAHFLIEKTDDAAQPHDMKDAALAKHGPILLNLDPKSHAGIAYAAQLTDRENEKKAQEQQQIKDGRTDVENLAEHSAREAELNKPAS